MNPKYRNGTEVKVGDVAIGCWQERDPSSGRQTKLVATVCVVRINTVDKLQNNVGIAYINGKPEGVNRGTIDCSSDVLILLDDVFSGEIIDQSPEKPWLESNSLRPLTHIA